MSAPAPRSPPRLSTLPGCKKDATDAEPLKVAAAADLSFAFKDLGAAYEKKTGQKVVFSFGATGLLEKQIAEGAPFDVFAAANVAFADDAVKAGACLEDTKATYATGHLVMFTPNEAAVHPKAVADLQDPRITKIAIANPEHAPYGKAAKQALERAGSGTTCAARSSTARTRPADALYPVRAGRATRTSRSSRCRWRRSRRASRRRCLRGCTTRSTRSDGRVHARQGSPRVDAGAASWRSWRPRRDTR